MFRETEVPGLYFEGYHWWIANGLANLLLIGIVLMIANALVD